MYTIDLKMFLNVFFYVCVHIFFYYLFLSKKYLNLNNFNATRTWLPELTVFNSYFGGFYLNNSLKKNKRNNLKFFCRVKTSH